MCKFSEEQIKKVFDGIKRSNSNGEIVIHPLSDRMYCVGIYVFYILTITEEIKINIMNVETLKCKTFVVPYLEFLEILDENKKFSFFKSYIELLEKD